MSLVVDSGIVVAALVDSGPTGTWADELLGSDDLAAPHLMPVEAANILRRAALAGEISVDTAAMAHADLLEFRVELFSYEPFGPRAWELRDNVTAYDAWYVALAESLGATLATADLKLSRAPGPRCSFATPPAVEPTTS
jgi:predicted nucleic acid-binding protein